MSIAEFNVLSFGADPCGGRDSYQAFQDWAHAITAQGGGTGIVPPGTYKINQVVEMDEKGVYQTKVRDFVFEECHGLHLVGYGATIDLEGDVHLKRLGDHSSDKHMLCPFFIYRCTNVCLEGFEINGNAKPRNWEPGVIEPGGHCVHIASSKHVTIRNLRIHDGWTDGISVKAADSAYPPRLACRNVVIENCEIYGNVRCNIAVHETRHIRISDCRLYDSGMGIDIEPNLRIGTDYDKDIRPPGSSRFTIIENCEIYNNQKPLSVGVRYSHVRVQGCFIDNQRDNARPVILSVPHCALLDCEIDTGTGRIDVAISGSDPGRNVFTMERCLIRSKTAMVNGVLTTGAGLWIAPDPTARPTRIKQALIANNRFINESTQAWFPVVDGAPVDNGSRFPNLSHGNSMLQLTFRDNYVFIPKEAHHGQGCGMPAVALYVQLAENNVYETDLASAPSSELPPAWNNGDVLYRPGDVVSESGVDYLCQVGHKATKFPDDLLKGFWKEVPPLSPAPVKWKASSDTLYEPGDVVIESGIHYLCRVDHKATKFSDDLLKGFWTPVEYIKGAFFQTLYQSESGKPPRFGVLVRNERFLSAGDGNSFKPDNSNHDNKFPYSKGVEGVP